MGGPIEHPPAAPYSWMGEARFPDNTRRAEWRPPADLPWWVRHPHLGSLLVWSVVIAAALMLGGCECGRLWPCPGGFG